MDVSPGRSLGVNNTPTIMDFTSMAGSSLSNSDFTNMY